MIALLPAVLSVSVMVVVASCGGDAIMFLSANALGVCGEEGSDVDI